MRPAIISNIQIAVVDNERLMRDFIVTVMMYSINREILAFEHARDLQAHIGAGKRVHLLLSELHLPDMSGFDLLGFIKQEHPETYFIAMSTNPADEMPAAELNADVFLAKPFALQDLFDIVERFVVKTPHLRILHQ
ncbi:MAG: response regulator [Desulfatitalea sp.]|nr:response regulator [Desulfatitalea sp.]NNK00921.1 response regulator [Desulfatitalea sp.]